jgi:hypothetical protein
MAIAFLNPKGKKKIPLHPSHRRLRVRGIKIKVASDISIK